MILTDANGHPIPKPEASDFPDVVSYLRAYHDWKQRVTNLANQSFDHSFRQAMKDGTTGQDDPDDDAVLFI